MLTEWASRAIGYHEQPRGIAGEIIPQSSPQNGDLREKSMSLRRASIPSAGGSVLG
jgi:hypothetical protein